MMQTLNARNAKLDMFLDLALMDQQFGLVIAKKSQHALHSLAEVKELFHKKKIQYRQSADPKILFEDSLNGDLILFELNLENLRQVLEAVRQIRLHGSYENNGQQFQLPIGVKIVFTIDETLLEKQTNECQDQILYTFSPIFRFAL